PAAKSGGWRLLEPGGPAATYYVFNTFAGFLDSGGSTSDGTGVVTDAPNSGIYQQWTFVPLIDGHDLIVNAGSGLVLDDPPSFSTNYVDQWQLNDGANQEWNLDPVQGGDGQVFAIFNENSGGVLEGTGYPDRVLSDTSGYVGGASQQWWLRPVSALDPA